MNALKELASIYQHKYAINCNICGTETILYSTVSNRQYCEKCTKTYNDAQISERTKAMLNHTSEGK